MSAYAINTVVGRISHVGQFSYDNVVHTYSTIEVQTSAGRVDLTNVMAPNAFDRAIEPERDVAMAVLQGDGKKVQNFVIGIFDVSAQRTFSDDQMSSIRAQAVKQALLLSITAIVWLPVAFLLFVVPGVVGLWLLWKSWASVARLPTAEDVRQAIAALPARASDAR
jgi:hypothetical protein